MKNSINNWLCYRCHDYRSSKHDQFVNALTLSCSTCSEYLEYDSRNENYKDNYALCPKCEMGIKIPLCAYCEEPLKPYNAKIKDLEKIDREVALDYEKVINKKKSWWNR